MTPEETTDLPDFCRHGCYWDCEHRRGTMRDGWEAQPLRHVNARTWPVADPSRTPDMVDAARFAFPRRFVAPQLDEPLRSLARRVNDGIAQYAQRTVAREHVRTQAAAVGYPSDLWRDAQYIERVTAYPLDEAANAILIEWLQGVPVDEIAERIVRRTA